MCDSFRSILGPECKFDSKASEMGVEDNHQHCAEGPPAARRAYVDPTEKARSYQLEVVQKALEENTIVFLETGGGKTLIAVLWIDALKNLIRKPSKKIAVFLVPTRALVEQQAEAIEEHTHLKVGKFCGSMEEGGRWIHEWWQEQILKYEVFVMTPQILLDNLEHCLLKMEVIELLVFDECHRADKGHPYAKIMSGFYHPNKHSRPKVLGLTASPLNGKAGKGVQPGKIGGEMLKLDTPGELKSFLPNPSLLIRNYRPSYELHYVKTLSGGLRELSSKCVISDVGANSFERSRTFLDMKEGGVSKVYRKLDVCIHELGLWCTIEAANILLNNERLRPREQIASGAKEAFLREALSMLKAADQTDTSVNGEAQEDDRFDRDETLVSPKLLCLVDVIMENRHKYTKSIVFVKTRIEAEIVSTFMNSLKGLAFIKCLPLVGSMPKNSQQHTIERFRSDEVNMLVATDIAEEGLDIPSCFMVIRFGGVPETSRSSIQFRGRARQKESICVHLLESGNEKQVDDLTILQQKEKLMWKFAENRDDTVVQPPQMSEFEFFEVKSTGARVTTDSSVKLLYLYCSRLPTDGSYQPTPDFSPSQDSAGIIYEIRIPVTAPFQHVLGHPCVTGKMAKKVAALAACKRLHEEGALTDHLLPAFEPEETNSLSGEDPSSPKVQADSTARMELQSTLIPEALRGGWCSASAKVSLFGFAIQIVAKDGEYADFALFLEADLDNSTKRAVTVLNLRKGRTAQIQLVSRGQVEFDVNQLRDAMAFQEQIYSIALGPKTKEGNDHLSLPTLTNWDPGCLYLTLPVLPSTESPVSVDWKSMRRLLTEVVPQSLPLFQDARENIPADESYPTDDKSQLRTCAFFHMANGSVSPEAVINSLVETTYNGEEYVIVSVLWDMDCNSGFISHKPSQYRTYLDFYRKHHKLDIKHPKQFLLEAKKLSKVRNLLVNPKKAGPERESGTSVQLVPELCRLKVLGCSSQVVNTVWLIPSFLHRIEKFLLAVQLKKELKPAFSEAAKVSPTTVLEALTTARCEESSNLERLEFFGDSFLKFAVSKHLFLVQHKKLEGALSKMRDDLISNTFLHERGVARNLTMYINDELFDPLHWSAPSRPCRVQCDRSNQAIVHAAQLGGKTSNRGEVKCSEGHRWRKKKVVADVVEALIAAHLVDAGSDAALAFMDWLGISVYFDNNLVTKASTRCAGDIGVVQEKQLSEVEDILGYKFENKAILVQALTHKSFQAAPRESCYERLEFLGDAVLQYLLTCHLWSTYPDSPPGLLTDLRSEAVSNDSFANVAVRHDLHRFPATCRSVAEEIKNFVLSRNDKEQFDKVPKVLGDLVESLAGAVLVDAAFDIDKVWAVFEPLLQPIVTPQEFSLRPVRELEELCSKRKFVMTYSTTLKGRERLAKCTVSIGTETIVAEATRTDKTNAKRLAACRMLAKLKDLDWHHPGRDPTTASGCQAPESPGRNLGHVSDELNSPRHKHGSTLEISQDDPVVPSSEEVLVLASEVDRDDIVTAAASFVKQQDPSTRDTPFDASHFQPPVCDGKTEDGNDSMEQDSFLRSLLDVLLRQPGFQHSNVGAGVAATDRNFKDEIDKGAAENVDGLKGFPNREYNPPSSSREQSLPGWSVHATSLNENLGRPRDDLYCLCGWPGPKYEERPGYPQGPPHAPRFAYLVTISCWLKTTEGAYKSDICGEGEPMKTKALAKDSAASSALARLQENFKSGRIPVQPRYVERFM